jgi:hypothetical protein
MILHQWYLVQKCHLLFSLISWYSSYIQMIVMEIK